MTARSLDIPVVTRLVADATTAPSMHNAQPWIFRHVRGSGTLELRMDPARTMPREDPAHRALHIGCGAALFNLRVAAAHEGWDPRIDLLPDPAEPTLLAEAAFTRPTGPDDELAALYPALRKRHSNRFPFTDEIVPQAVRDELSGVAVAEGARLVFLGAWQTEEVLTLVRDAEAEESMDPEVRAEVARWAWRKEDDALAAAQDPAHAARTSGIPTYAFGPRRYDGRAPVRDFAAHERPAGRGAATFEQRPCLAVLGTRDDGPADWLRAGQALERVLLQATLDGLATSLNSHVLEWPELRWAVRDPRSAMGHAQMLIRLGYGPTAPATPRRPVDEVLDIRDPGA
ncbi:Acg family FMN-binding oxidoreductase [Streptomyces sp. TRM49041]|uniref:Acg family FMN-binding oxidoreductase n=1 Tax=Streptomyces sp. TRM49041 TaxID=2603216 RepID=UPI0011EDB6A1|nr:nitroreductase [Streptomyces sp. TRM49041]